ncbi:hypothetical protein BRC85_06225 [Halobacteriales archaeon QS_1_69_70]|nr:MAG: hypothetical protein BRC85_06225 [Halobacteriales archaeon QS_1_69_70]
MSTDDTLQDTPDLEGIEEDGDGPSVEFYGGKWLSAVPIVFFIVWAIVQSALFRVGDTTGLAAGMLSGGDGGRGVAVGRYVRRDHPGRRVRRGPRVAG